MTKLSENMMILAACSATCKSVRSKKLVRAAVDASSQVGS